MEGPDRDHRRLQRIDPPGDDVLQRAHELRRARDRVDGRVGSPACPPRPVIVISKKSAAAIQSPGTAATFPYASGVHRWQP